MYNNFESTKKNNKISNRANFLLWIVLFIVIIFTAISNNSNFSFIFHLERFISFRGN